MLSGISMTCFAASYAVALALEITRLFLRVQIRTAAAIVMACAGLLAHTLYLYVHVERGVITGQPFASWYHWCLLAAWLLAAVYVGLALTHPKTAVGLFMLPLVLLLVAAAYPFRDVGPFPRADGVKVWGAMHGLLFLAGSVVVTLGFISGVMYLIQSYRLKHKLPPRQGLRLPSLEWLQRVNSRAMIFSTCLLGAGLLSGILLNVSMGKVPWTDPAICTSGLLLVWLVIAVVVEIFYKAARRGTKVAYLTVASFVFLVIVMLIVLFGPTQHAAVADVSPPGTSLVQFEIRNPKSETSTNDQNPRGHMSARTPDHDGPPVSNLQFRVSNLFRISDFGFRVSRTCVRGTHWLTEGAS